MSAPPLSVVIPVYNAERYLREAIGSVQAQTFRDFELIVVDDGSTDRSKSILEEIGRKDRRLRVVSRSNTGIVGALNDGLDLSTGEFVARMDADDWALPERFARQIEYLRGHPDCVCVGSAFNYMDDRGAPIKWTPRAADHDVLEKQLLAGDGGALIHPAIMLRRAAVEGVGRYRVEAQWVEDLDLYLRLAQVGRLANLDDVLLHYRYHTQSVNFTRNEGRHQRKLWVLEQAHSARGLPFDRAAWPPPASNPALAAEDARDFALSSLRFPQRRTSWRYAIRAVKLAPADRRAWRVLSYVFKVTFGLISRKS